MLQRSYNFARGHVFLAFAVFHPVLTTYEA